MMAEDTRNNVSLAKLRESSRHESGSAFLSYGTQPKWACIRGPTSCEALQALEVAIGYAESTFEFHQDADLLIQLGRINEKLEKLERLERLERQLKERDFMDNCARTGLHSVDKE